MPLLLADDANRYVYGPGGMVLEQVDESEAVTYLHHDALGSTRLLTEAGAAATATFSYDPYGAPAGSSGTARTPFGFAGEYTDAESGMQYLRARYYDPATGQFITRDPLTAADGEPYGYAGGSPLAYADPSGLWPSVGDIVGAAGDAAMFVSDAAAGALDELTFGLSNALAGVDGSCAGAGYGFGRIGGFFGSFAIGAEIRAGAGAERAASEEVVRGVEHGPEVLGFDLNVRNYVNRSNPEWSVGVDLHPTRHGGPHFDLHRRGAGKIYSPPIGEPWHFPN